MQPGDVLLLENSRFDPREKKNDPELVKELARLGDVYVNDAFSAAHRAHATTAGLATVLPAVAGLQMEKEVTALEGLLAEPEAAVRRGPGRRQGHRQDQGDRPLPRAGRPPADRRRHEPDVPQSAGTVGSERARSTRKAWPWRPRRCERRPQPVRPGACRATSWSRTALEEEAATMTGRTVRAPSPTVDGAWTSVRRPRRLSGRSSPRRARSSGTARWACSRSRRSPPGPGRGRGHGRVPGGHRRGRRGLRRGAQHVQAWRTGSITSPWVAGRHLSSSKERNCPAWPIAGRLSDPTDRCETRTSQPACASR